MYSNNMELKELLLKSNINEVADLLSKGYDNLQSERLKAYKDLVLKHPEVFRRDTDKNANHHDLTRDDFEDDDDYEDYVDNDDNEPRAVYDNDDAIIPGIGADYGKNKNLWANNKALAVSGISAKERRTPISRSHAWQNYSEENKKNYRDYLRDSILQDIEGPLKVESDYKKPNDYEFLGYDSDSNPQYRSNSEEEKKAIMQKFRDYIVKRGRNTDDLYNEELSMRDNRLDIDDIHNIANIENQIVDFVNAHKNNSFIDRRLPDRNLIDIDKEW